MKQAGLISSSIYRGMIGILATTALLLSVNAHNAKAGYPNSNVDPDLLRAAEQLQSDSKDLSYEVQANSSSNYSYGSSQAVMDAQQFSFASSQYVQGLRYFGSQGSSYSILLNSYLRLQNSIKVLLKNQNVSYKMDMVDQSLQEVRFYVECGQPSNGGGYATEQAQQISQLMRQSVMRTKMLASSEGTYGSFWRETALKDLDELDQQLLSLIQELQYTGTSMLLRDVQFVFSRSKRSIIRGGFSIAVINSYRNTELLLDQLRNSVASLPIPGGFGQGGYGNQYQSNQLPPVACNAYRRKR